MQGIITSRENTGQTAAEILSEAKNINSPDNVLTGNLNNYLKQEVTIDGKTLVGTKDQLVKYLKDYLS